MTTVIYPLIASTFRFVPGPVGYLSDIDFVRRINRADFDLLVHRLPTEYIGLLDSPFKCFYFMPEQSAVREEEIFSRAGLIAFTLNYFAAHDALEFPCAIVLQRRRRGTDIRFHTQPSASSVSWKSKYRLRARTTLADLRRFFLLVHDAETKSPRVRVMVDRFNSALRRERIEDKIIDLSIALETMLEEGSEISFRLSLLLAHMAAEQRSDMPDRFKAFRTLYDARSKIVHGGLHSPKSRRVVAAVAADFDNILRFSKICMLYYFSFVETNSPASWNEHSTDLLLGSATRAL
jgi:hypothetical protein